MGCERVWKWLEDGWTGELGPEESLSQDPGTPSGVTYPGYFPLFQEESTQKNHLWPVEYISCSKEQNKACGEDVYSGHPAVLSVIAQHPSFSDTVSATSKEYSEPASNGHISFAIVYPTAL
jgi:hypothetical protein